MDDTSKFFLFIIGTLAVLAFAAISFYRWWVSQRHTRERFAFFSVRVFVTFLVTAMTLLLVRNQILEVLISIINALFDYNIPYAAPADMIGSSIFILFCAGMLWLMVTTMHRNWNGLASTRQVDFKETGRSISVFTDHQYYWRHRDEISIYQAKAKTTSDIFSPYEPDTRPWHIKAANLFSLLDQQYIIKEEQWYGEYHCYISHYGQDNEKLGILCLEEPPSPSQLNAFLLFIENKGGEFHKLIVATAKEGQRKRELHGRYHLEFRYESEMLDNLIPLSRYKDFINDYFDQYTLENSDLKISDMYVSLGGHSMKVEKGKLISDQAIKSVEGHILKWAKGERTNSAEHLVVLGEYGQGKTVLMHKIVKEMLNHPGAYGRIPILIELRGLSPRNDDEFAIFGRWANRFQAKAEALWELHRAGKLFIILDGFDEMDLVGDTALLFSHFTQLWTLARVPQSQLLIVGRSNLFADDDERRMALGIQDPRIHLPYAKGIYLDKLTADQISQVLRQVQPATKQGILRALENTTGNGSFAELVGRPSTLYQLSTVWDNELAQKKDRLNSATVIGSFLKKTYDRQEKKAVMVLTSSERHYFMMGIAVGMMLDHTYTNQIKHKDLKRWVEKLWTYFPENLLPYQDALQGSKAQNFLPKRLRENKDTLDTILKDVRVGGVLVQDLSGRDVFKFAHKSYLEYLVSAFFSGFVLQNEHDRQLLMMVNSIAKATGFSEEKLKDSPDVEQFTAELIAAQIELLDARGIPLPIAENQQKYSRKLYEMLILKTYPIRGRLWPSATGWLSMHPDQKQFVAIGLLATLFIISFFSVQDEIWRYGLVVANSLLCCWWAGILLKYSYRKEANGKVKTSNFLSKTRLYLTTCRQIKSPVIRFSDSLDIVLQNRHKEEAYKATVQLMLAMCIAFAGIFTSVFAFAFTSVVVVELIDSFLAAFAKTGLGEFSVILREISTNALGWFADPVEEQIDKDVFFDALAGAGTVAVTDVFVGVVSLAVTFVFALTGIVVFYWASNAYSESNGTFNSVGLFASLLALTIAAIVIDGFKNILVGPLIIAILVLGAIWSIQKRYRETFLGLTAETATNDE